MAWELVGSFTQYSKYGGGFDFDKYRYKFVKVANTGVIIFTDAVGYPNGKSLYSFGTSEPNVEYIVPSGSTLESELRSAGPLYHKSGTGVVNIYREALNNVPKISISTTDARTLYENDTINVSGTVQDTDIGNVIMVKYQINSGATRTIHTSISDGSQVPFNRTLTFRNKRLYDGQTAVTVDLQEGAQNTIRVWAEDDQGGRSSDVYRSFQIVPNRPATLTINPVEQQDSLIDTDSITISGSVNDPDGNTVTVEYRLFGESFEQVYNGAGGNFSFNVQLSRLNTGDNNITIRAMDSYGATTTRTLKVTKAGAVTPLKRSIATYRINPTNGTAQGVVLWIQRDSGDLDVTLEISATAEGEEEVWEPMTLDSTAFVEDGIEEDEWIYEATDPKEKILLRMTLERENTNSTAGVRLISGVLS